MFTMLYVNDVAGVRGIPWWMHHYHPDTANGMTFVDWVFGGFLFIVGVSIPLAFANRLARGESTPRLMLHVLTRTFGLLLLGVFMVNYEHIDVARMGWPRGLWPFLMYLCGIFAFLAPLPPRWRKLGMILRVIGFGGLMVLAFCFRNQKGERMQPEWWGILGLIGWAYLTASVLYLLFRRWREALVACTALLVGIFLFDRTGFFDKPWCTTNLPWLSWLHDYLNFGILFGTHAAIAMAGVVLATFLQDASMTPRRRLAAALLWGVGLAIGAVLIYPLFGINKNDATPSWALICAAVTCWLWIMLSIPIDLAHVERPLNFFIRGGQNVLLAYLMAPLFAAFRSLIGLKVYDNLGATPGVGIVRSLLLASVILFLAGYLKDRGVRLKL